MGERDRVDEGEAVAGELLEERDGGGVGRGAEEDVGALVGLGVEVEVLWLRLAPCIKYSLGPRVIWVSYSLTANLACSTAVLPNPDVYEVEEGHAAAEACREGSQLS